MSRENSYYYRYEYRQVSTPEYTATIEREVSHSQNQSGQSTSGVSQTMTVQQNTRQAAVTGGRGQGSERSRQIESGGSGQGQARSAGGYGGYGGGQYGRQRQGRNGW